MATTIAQGDITSQRIAEPPQKRHVQRGFAKDAANAIGAKVSQLHEIILSDRATVRQMRKPFCLQ